MLKKQTPSCSEVQGICFFNEYDLEAHSEINPCSFDIMKPSSFEHFAVHLLRLTLDSSYLSPYQQTQWYQRCINYRIYLTQPPSSRGFLAPRYTEISPTCHGTLKPQRVFFKRLCGGGCLLCCLLFLGFGMWKILRIVCLEKYKHQFRIHL